MAKKKQKETKRQKSIREEIFNRMLQLATSGFGFVAALAWNDFIKKTMDKFLSPIVGDKSGVLSLFLYAVIVTSLAVLVTYNLARLSKKKE